jgi:hypothetical protein
MVHIFFYINFITLTKKKKKTIIGKILQEMKSTNFIILHFLTLVINSIQYVPQQKHL